MRILYIHSTQVPAPLDRPTDRFFLFSETMEGDVLQPIKLKRLGWYDQTEREELEALAGDSKQIELVRVVIEGLAAGVPVIGSDVGGIPDLIHQGENGFVVPGGNVRELEARIRELLADPELRRRMGANGYQFAHTQLTETVYVEEFTAMVAAAVRGAP
jgi:glycosyltransferase involved in cell wall biosynthesis